MSKKINILGVDDKPENLLALEAVLEDLNINLIKASSGEEALECLLRVDCALILMDVMMPGLGGYETAKLIRSREKSRQIPIIFITAINPEQEHVFKGYDCGGVDYLFKPIVAEVLRNKVSIFVELFQQRKRLKDKAQELQIANDHISMQQQELCQSEVRFRTAFEQSFQFMAILDPAGRVIELNKLAQKLCGIYTGSLVGQFLWNICWVGQDDENMKLRRAIDRAAEGECICDEATFTDIKGSTRFLYRSVSPVKDESGKVVYITVQGHDITDKVIAENEKRNLEILLQQAQKMEALGALAGGIAHDFNNVLSVIIGNADLAVNSCDRSSPQLQFLNRIHEAGRKARELVKQILSFSRQAEIEKVVLQPSQVLVESIKLLRSSIPTTIEIVQDIDPQCGAILADPTQYHQIIMNLCTNAFHAMEEKGGKLMIGLCREDVDYRYYHDLGLKPGGYAHLIVEDNGYGIDKEHLEKIFDPYFTTKEKGKGTGMGLAIVHGIVKGHGGVIHVDRKDNEGTAFHVYLPLVNREGDQKEEPLDVLSYGSEHILLVDDEEPLLEMVKNMLELMGYQVTSCISSRDALHVFEQSPDTFDLVITDQTMPGMTGFELAGKILSIRTGMPIVLCTGYSPNISRKSIAALGIKELVLKPLALDEFSNVIRRAIDQAD
ncbi:ATP-binding response regulator [Desulfopila inferna]|uniref:ATP-binding response regulator n=1 Tax=Desulfopila inferna TaxID=468528 RepID=UPI001965ADA6|nr:response regulator [Desulfopila inferna]MBM9604983.1 response regulator [Desulfopila inferna]